MTVEDLIEELRQLPPTATVVARIWGNERPGGFLETLPDPRRAPIVAAVYSRGEVRLQLDE